MSFKNRRILITAGPTWVAIDDVRVISNMASGETGVLLADKLAGLGAKVTLLLGPVALEPKSKKVKVINFRFFDELKTILCRQLEKARFDTIVHSAAVADYAPVRKYSGKISSGINKLSIELKPTVKLIDKVKQQAAEARLIGFKFLAQAGKGELIRSANLLKRHSSADVVVANTVNKSRYEAYIVCGKTISRRINNKKQLVNALLKQI